MTPKIRFVTDHSKGHNRDVLERGFSVDLVGQCPCCDRDVWVSGVSWWEFHFLSECHIPHCHPRGPTWDRAEQLRPNTTQCRCRQGSPSSCWDLFPTPFCAAAEWQLSRRLLDTLCLFEGRNSFFASQRPRARCFWLWQVSRRSGHGLQHFPARDQYPASRAPALDGRNADRHVLGEAKGSLCLSPAEIGKKWIDLGLFSG